MKKKTTLKMLAEILNVSVSTVSKALNDSHEISEETKLRIQKAAKQHHYSPNLAARSLKTKKTSSIGVIIPNILGHYFAKVLSGIEHVANEKGYNIITCISDEKYDKELTSVNMLSCGRVDGIIVSLAKETQLIGKYKHFIEAQKNGLEVIMFDRVTDKVECDKVIINDIEAAFNATNELISSGSENILFVSNISQTSVGAARLKGYKKAITESKKYKRNYLFYDIQDYKVFSKDLLKLFKRVKIDAVLAAEELSGVHAMNTLIGAGYKVPEEVGVLGFSDGILAENSNPPLTTMNQFGVEIGEIAAKKLIDRLEATYSQEYTTTVIETELIKRGSTN